MQNRHEYFKKLLFSKIKLQEALMYNPSLLNEQDEMEMTLLHHAVLSENVLIQRIIFILLNTFELDLSLKMKNDTALHLAAWQCNKDQAHRDIFLALLNKAVENDFDFSTLDSGGKTVLQITAIVQKGNQKFLDYTSCVGYVLNSCKKAGISSGLNVLSSSGCTAFYYAIKHKHIWDANRLLNAGAHPALHADPNYSPIRILENHLKFDPKNDDLICLKYRMRLACVKTYMEVKKNARVLAMAARTHTSLFATLPNELLHKIASETGRDCADSMIERFAGYHLDVEKKPFKPKF